MSEVAIVQRLATSPFGGRRLRDARIGIAVARADGTERRWLTGVDRCVAYAEHTVDAWVRCTAADLDAMLAGQPPAGRVSMVLGDRDAAPRVMQARALCALAALGWCGRWPDPAANSEHVELLREAIYDLELGPRDAIAAAFPASAPLGLEEVRSRFTDGARRTWATCGLPGHGRAEDEVATDASPAVLRAAALWVAESGAPPERVDLGVARVRFTRTSLPLPDAFRTLWFAHAA
jgi:hypothetical protein